MRLEHIDYPYSTMYKKAYITTNDEGRKLVIFIQNGKAVHGTPYARYLMAVKLKRFLNKNEQVDHIDNDKTNDTIENLQILTQKENINKYQETLQRKPPEHGSLKMYRKGCRCDKCRKSKSDYMIEYYKKNPEKRELRNLKRRKAANLTNMSLSYTHC